MSEPQQATDLAAVFESIRKGVEISRAQVAKMMAFHAERGTPPRTPEQNATYISAAIMAGTSIAKEMQETWADGMKFMRNPCCQQHASATMSAMLTAENLMAKLYAQIVGGFGALAGEEGADRDIDGIINKMEAELLGAAPAKAPVGDLGVSMSMTKH